MSALTPDPSFPFLGVTPEWLQERAAWISRDTGAPGAIDLFFDTAGRLMRLLQYDYLLLGPMFFHAVIGLEAMLRVHFGAHRFEPETKESFHELLGRAAAAGLITDRIFSPPCERKAFEKLLGAEDRAKIRTQRPASYAEHFCLTIPKLRNAYFHGGFIFSSEYLLLAIHVREAADVLVMPRTPAWKT